MTEGDPGATAPYTDAARARLVMAYEACELAERARAAVPIGEHELKPDGTVRSPGAVLGDAARVLAAAQRFFEAAAVYERMGGTDWQLIGDVLEVSPQAARVRFAMAEADFREGLLAPEGTGSGEGLPASEGTGSAAAVGEANWLRAYMAREPLEAALDLDDWVLRHEDSDSGPGAAPVSGGLVRKDPGDRTRRQS